MYSRVDKIVMWLSTFEFMTYKRAKFIVDNYEDLEDLFDNIDVYRNELVQIFELEEFHEIVKGRSLNYIERTIQDYEKLGIEVITIRSDKYPELLREIDSSPIMLYCKGNIDLLKSDCLGVVGTRRATKYGKDNCTSIIKDVASDNITIVSGLAEGIDTVAHKSTLEVSGKTIAVLGGGLLNIYPSSNVSLAKEILDKDGLLVSEYKPNEPALTYHFPIRNRIIAGLSKAVFIVEATEKSGSMHTKNYALDYNRHVFALPGRASDIYSVGCNKCIKSGQAEMVLSSNDIIDFYGKDMVNAKEEKVIQLSYEEELIYNCLLGEEKHFDEILKSTGMDTKTLQTMLMRMILKGIIDKQPNNYYGVK